MVVVVVVIKPSFLKSNFLLLTLCQKISVIKQQTICLKCERTSMRINFSRFSFKEGDENACVYGILMRNAMCVVVVKHTKIATPNECAYQQTHTHTLSLPVMRSIRAISSTQCVYTHACRIILHNAIQAFYMHNSWASVRMLSPVPDFRFYAIVCS